MKWIFAILGYVFLHSAVGAILGFIIGSILEDSTVFKQATTQTGTGGTGSRGGTTYIPNDFSSALLVLCAAVMKADQKVMRSELDYVRSFFLRQFGEVQTNERMLAFREMLKRDVGIGQVCEQIRYTVDGPSKLQLLHLLFGLAASDGFPSDAEITVISQISHLIGVNPRDLESIKAMFIVNNDSAYKILEVERTATDDEIKKAYRRMAIQYHPDKVHHLGEEYQKDAQEKFKKINDAYEKIKRERGMN
jgi:DnaJ like chaperone protein